MKLDNVRFIEVTVMGVTDTHAIIDHGNEQYTSMLKSNYDEMIAAPAITPMFNITTDTPTEQTQEGEE
jgi:hypothetical protein